MAASATAPTTSQDEPRKCWICFSDETEDTPLSSTWKSPCPCSLTAHESCLLDWVAEIEETATKAHKKTKPIQCPQCKAKITVKQPVDPIVSSVKALDRVAAKLVLPGIVLTIGGSVWTGCLVHGLSSVYVLFGQQDFNRLMRVDTNEALSVKWILGLPLIPVMLVLSRTALADNILPVLPVIFFASTVPQQFGSSTGPSWPPSAALSFALLPYIRSLYNALYHRFVCPHLTRWRQQMSLGGGEEEPENSLNENINNLREMQPRANNGNRNEVVNNDGMGFEINLELNMFGGDTDDENEEDEVEQLAEQIEARLGGDVQPVAVQVPAAAPPGTLAEFQNRPHDFLAPGPVEIEVQVPEERVADVIAALPVPHDAPGGQQNAAAPAPVVLPAVAPAPQNNNNNAANAVTLSASRIAESIVGALMFPAMAAASGALLKEILPRSLVMVDKRRPGLLQTQWGRSIVGGCALVVLKDALWVYTKWMTARNHKRRRIEDYKGPPVRHT